MTPQRQDGFTLIEVLVYLGLFALLIGGAVGAAYNVMESAGRNQTRSMLQEEGNFLTGKINWVLSGIESVNAPLLGNVSSQLLVTKSDPALGGVRLDLSGDNLELSKSGNPAEILNNSNVILTDMRFSHQGSASAAEWVTATFTLSAKTPDGQDITQDFLTTKYLRK